MTPPASGHFKAYITGLIEQKQAMGHPYKTSALCLNAFSVFTTAHYPDEMTLSKAMAMHWAERKPGEHTNGLVRRITPVRQLAKYMLGIGIDAYIIPPGIPGKSIRYVPHIFTDQELQAFFAAVDQCRINPSRPARHLIIPVFFRVLYCCGLRSSEARRLSIEDVDLEIGKLTIRQSKGNKDRTVMLSDDVLVLCRIYHAKIRQILPDRTAFFPNQSGQYYHCSLIDDWFHLFWEKTGMANVGSGNPPRVHDFRYPNLNKIHTFFKYA